MTVNKLLVADRVNDICPPYSFVALRNVSNRGVSVCIRNFTICQALCQELKCSREQERSGVCSPQILNLTEGTDQERATAMQCNEMMGSYGSTEEGHLSQTCRAEKTCGGSEV